MARLKIIFLSVSVVMPPPFRNGNSSPSFFIMNAKARGSLFRFDTDFHLYDKNPAGNILQVSLMRCHPDSNWRIKVLQTFALPLGYGTVKKWSGRRDSDPRHPPWQGGTLPTELLPHKCALGRNRTTDTVIFSHMLYRLSYQGRYGDPEGARTLDLQRDRLAL